jgi:predicted component of type VI protein secretion system
MPARGFPDDAMDVKLLVIKGSRKTREIVLHDGETIIGRQLGCGLRIPSATVSRRHCRLGIHGSLVTIEDLGSANGCFLNGARIHNVEFVRPGDRLEIGPVTFRVEYRAPEGEAVGGSTEDWVPSVVPEPPADGEDWVQALPVEEFPDPPPARPAPKVAPVEGEVPLVLEHDEDWQLSIEDELGETP